MILRYGVFTIVLVIAVAVSVAMKGPRSTGQNWQSEDHAKYLKFSHTFHVKEQGVACEDCHYNAKTSKVSSDNLIGDHKSCESCHEEQINPPEGRVNSDCGFCHTNPDDIVPIPNPEREIIFSHEQHTTQDTIKCEMCHAGVDNATYVTELNMPSMPTCMNCHTTRSVSTECAECHTDFAGLIPEDHLVAEFRKDHKRLTRIASIDVSCATCHTESFCQDCHTGAEPRGFGSFRDLMAEPFPRMPKRDTPRESKLQQVHDLNYRFTHSIDVKSKRIECTSCHEQETFCVTCHGAGGNITQERIKPPWHVSGPSFAPLPTQRGSGGGTHAELARRDLETCVACHDVEGADPTCLRCHTESGGIR